MTDLMKKWLAPPYSGLVGVLAAVVGIASEFTDPASIPVLLAVFGPHWTKGLVAACALIVLVSKVPEVRAVLNRKVKL